MRHTVTAGVEILFQPRRALPYPLIPDADTLIVLLLRVRSRPTCYVHPTFKVHHVAQCTVLYDTLHLTVS